NLGHNWLLHPDILSTPLVDAPPSKTAPRFAENSWHSLRERTSDGSGCTPQGRFSARPASPSGSRTSVSQEQKPKVVEPKVKVEARKQQNSEGDVFKAMQERLRKAEEHKPGDFARKAKQATTIPVLDQDTPIASLVARAGRTGDSEPTETCAHFASGKLSAEPARPSIPRVRTPGPKSILPLVSALLARDPSRQSLTVAPRLLHHPTLLVTRFPPTAKRSSLAIASGIAATTLPTAAVSM
ncbi:hypothetical protein FS749_010334, partial [Ceratobasidium sp. UAMH 11750]